MRSHRPEALSPLSGGALTRSTLSHTQGDRLSDDGLLFALISGRWRPPSEPTHNPPGGARPSDSAHQAAPPGLRLAGPSGRFLR